MSTNTPSSSNSGACRPRTRDLAFRWFGLLCVVNAMCWPVAALLIFGPDVNLWILLGPSLVPMLLVAIGSRIYQAQTLARAERCGFRICPHCGYDLAASPLAGSCPECGTSYNPTSLKREWHKKYTEPESEG